MLVSDFVPKVILRATGKATPVSQGDAKWNKIIGIANIKIDDWQNEPEVDWASLYDRQYSLGTVTATDSYTIDTDDVRKISGTFGDPVRVYYPDGIGYIDYDIVDYDALKMHPGGRYCAQIGDQLVFSRPFTSDDPQFGGTIYIPALLYADNIANPSDEIPVDIPNWLVDATAAEYIRTDVTRQDQYTNLATEANQIMDRMKDDNDGQISYVHSEFSPLSMTWLS